MKVILNVKKKFLFQRSTKIMSKTYSKFYESILEAAERGELWGITSEHSQLVQLELNLASCVKS